MGILWILTRPRLLVPLDPYAARHQWKQKHLEGFSIEKDSISTGSPSATCYDFTRSRRPTLVCANKTTKSLWALGGHRSYGSDHWSDASDSILHVPELQRKIRTEAILSDFAFRLTALLHFVIAYCCSSLLRVWPRPLKGHADLTSSPPSSSLSRAVLRECGHTPFCLFRAVLSGRT
ncbi:hypothetical protein Tco_0403501 [Tanacetum coccineum]